MSCTALVTIGCNPRFGSGSLRLDTVKLCFALDNGGMPCETWTYEQKDSNHLVEEFMLLANQSVARRIHQVRTGPTSAFSRCIPT